MKKRQNTTRTSSDAQTSILNSLIAILATVESDDLPPDIIPILRTRPHDVLHLAHEKLHAYPFSSVPLRWRRAYEEGAAWAGVAVLERELRQGEESCEEEWVGEVVRLLDMAIIMTGAPGRREGFGRVFGRLEEYLRGTEGEEECEAVMPGKVDVSDTGPPMKRRRVGDQSISVPSEWPRAAVSAPALKLPVPTGENLSLTAFQQHLDNGAKAQGPTPLLIRGAISHWPALDPSFSERNWRNSQYLFRRTLGGRRLVPVEIGRSYTDEGWTQKIITIREFVKGYMLDTAPVDFDTGLDAEERRPRAYLAQHDIFAQIQTLRDDICIPDYCYTSPPTTLKNAAEAACAGSEANVEEDQDSAEPRLNAWFGPPNTISPAHTDPHHNIFAQVVGHKYIRLFPPSQKERMYPRAAADDGIDMSNTSEVDVGIGMKVLEGWDWGDEVDPDIGAGFKDRFPLFGQAEYLEAVIGPGECLYIPRGWWHYVRSLSSSFSVSFWWD